MASLRIANRFIAGSTRPNASSQPTLGSLFRVVSNSVARCSSSLAGNDGIAGSSLEYGTLQKRFLHSSRSTESAAEKVWYVAPANDKSAVLSAEEQLSFIDNRLSPKSKERRPGLVSLHSLLDKAESEGDMRIVQEAFLKFKKGFIHTTPQTAGIFVNKCLHLGCVDVAVDSLIRRDEFGLWPGKATYARLMGVLSYEGRHEEVMNLLQAYKEMDQSPPPSVEMYKACFTALAISVDDLAFKDNENTEGDSSSSSSSSSSSEESAGESSSSSDDDDADKAIHYSQLVENASCLMDEVKSRNPPFSSKEITSLSSLLAWTFAAGGRSEDALGLIGDMEKQSKLSQCATVIALSGKGDIDGARSVYENLKGDEKFKHLADRANRWLTLYSN